MPAKTPHSNHSADDFPAIETRDGRPIFNLLVIGTSGSGKTVFLAAIAEQLSVLKESAFILTSSTTDQFNYFRSYYDTISRATADWPPPTPGPTEYEFIASCPALNTPAGKNLFWIRYTDYPGGYITRPRNEDGIRIRDVIRKAHIVVFLIDGSKLLYKKTNKSKADLPALGDVLNVIASYAQECVNRPIHFIITKWDVVKTKMNLEEARGYLMENRNFCEIASQICKLERPVHVIPVSAVGDGFAEWDAETNKMKKRPGATAQPYNLDVAMAFAISDAVVQRSLAALSTADILKKWVFRALVTGGPLAKGLTSMMIFVYDDAWIIRTASVINRLADTVAIRSGKALREIESRIQNAKDINSIVEAVVEKQKFMALKFLEENSAAAIHQISR
jgi:hypothetical protein